MKRQKQSDTVCCSAEASDGENKQGEKVQIKPRFKPIRFRLEYLGVHDNSKNAEKVPIKPIKPAKMLRGYQ